MIHATVALGDAIHIATETVPVTFGRDAERTICLDAEDTGISRWAGTVRWEHATWWLVNCSRRRSLIVTDDQIPRNVLPPRRRHPIDVPTRVIVIGAHGQHMVTVHPHGAGETYLPELGEPQGLPTAAGMGVKISEKDRLALAALFENYMINPARIESIRSYQAAAARLDLSRDQIRRRIDYLRQRLGKAGILGLDGANALYHLAEFVIASGLLTHEDLKRLPPRK
jgi:hypothetical protein